MRDSPKQGAVQIDEEELDTAVGGLLLPAVQKVREAASRMTATAGHAPQTDVQGN